MPFEFFVVGFFLICEIFFFDFSKGKNVWIFLSSLFLVFSYFVNYINIGLVSFNILVIVASFFVILYILSGLKSLSLRINISKVLTILVVYIVLNLINIDFNVFFNPLWLLGIIVLMLSFGNCGLLNDLFVLNFSLISVELLNILFLIRKLNFVMIFSREFVVSLVILNTFAVLKNLLIRVVRLKYEKIY